MNVAVSASSTPGRGKSSKKRGRDGAESSFGNLSNITVQGDLLSEFSFENDSDGVADGDSKKIRLGADYVTNKESSKEESNGETENDNNGEEGTQLGSGTDFIQSTPGVDQEPSPGEVPVHMSDADQQQDHGSC